MSASTEKKRSRNDFDPANEEKECPAFKKQKFDDKEENIIHMSESKVIFASEQPINNPSCAYKWSATLVNTSMFGFDDDREVILAKASFCVTKIKNLSKHNAGLDNLVDHKEFFNDILILENIKIMDGFKGFDYEICLFQRIIDVHVRLFDIIAIKKDESTKNICKKMEFSQLGKSDYWFRNCSLRHPDMNDVCVCFQDDSNKQKIAKELLSTFTFYQEKEIEKELDLRIVEMKDDHEAEQKVDIDINSCVTTFSSRVDATNDMIEEDFTCAWIAKLQCKSKENVITLATATFWLVSLTRLSNYGYEENVFTVFDATCHQLCDLFSAVMTHDKWSGDGPFTLYDCDRMNHFRVRCQGTVSDEIRDQFTLEMVKKTFRSEEMNEGGGGDLVYVDRVEVNEKYKGQGYGRCLVQKVIDNHARSFDAVVLKPYPLQWEKTDFSVDTKKKEALFERDRQKVIAVWESMWFYQFGGPKSKYWGRSEAWQHPTLDKFCKCFQESN